MRIKKIRDYLADASYDIQDRLFILLSFIAMISMICAIVGGIAIGENWEGLLFTFAGLVVLTLIIFLAFRYDWLRVAEVIIAVLTTFIVMPMVFFTSGGIYGGTPIWFMLSILYIGMILRGRARAALLICQILVISVCYYCEYKHIIEVIPHSEDMAFLDSFVTLIIVSCMMLLLVSFQTYIYRLENKRSEAQREEIDAMNKAQSRFFSNMSHEIRTPVNTIIGLNEMILREDTTPEVAEDAAIIQSSSRMLLNLINDILDMSKLQSGKMEINPVVYNTGDMLSAIVNMIWVRAREKGLEFIIDVDPEVPARLVGDEVRIEQILLNILTNAVKYTNSGSVSFFIGTKKTEKQQDVSMVYTVTDTGMGIKKESMPYLFSAFRRIDEQQTRLIEGTGLGLSITKELLDMMGGDIRVNSIYTEGTTFTVEIPQGFVDDEKVGALDLQTHHDNLQKRLLGQSFEAPDVKILVVDDNSTNLMVVKKLMKDTGIRVDTVQSGVQALQMTLGNEYHLVFMDHLMPGMDGITCMHRIREQAGGLCRESKIVALTANAGTENQKLYMREGFDGYLLKPVSGYQLEEEILRQLPGELIRFNGAQESGSGDFLKAHRVRRFPILISTESVCDLPEDELNRSDIAVIPYHVYTQEGDFFDGTETHARGVLSIMEEGAKIRSDAPSKEEYEQFFAGQLKKAINIIHISMSGTMSEGYKRALAASETFDNVTVIDCRCVSSGLGMLVMKARDMVREGMSVERIRDELVKNRENICAGFIVEDSSRLEETGGFPAFFTRLSQIFYLHPVLEIRGGRIRVRRFYIGNRERIISAHIHRMLRNSPASRVNTDCLFITHTGLGSEELSQIRSLVEKRMTFNRIILQRAGAAVTTELGSGCFGLIFETI